MGQKEEQGVGKQKQRVSATFPELCCIKELRSGFIIGGGCRVKVLIFVCCRVEVVKGIETSSFHPD